MRAFILAQTAPERTKKYTSGTVSSARNKLSRKKDCRQEQENSDKKKRRRWTYARMYTQIKDFEIVTP